MILTFLGQLAIYFLLIWLTARTLGLYRPLSRFAIFLACLVVGLISGLLTTCLWYRLDSIVFPNLPANLLGDQVYIWATSRVLPGVPDPHYEIAWPMRIPQIFTFTSILLFGVLGLVIQTTYNRMSN